MKIKLLTKAVTLLMVTFTLGLLSSCSKDNSSSPDNETTKNSKEIIKKDLGNPTFVFKADIGDATNLFLNSKKSTIDSINWGDGNISKSGEDLTKHNYKVNDKYTIKVYAPSNVEYNFDFSKDDEKTPEIELVSISDKITTSLTFKGKSITTIDDEFLNGVPKITDASKMFSNCTNLKNIPSNLLSNTNITNASYMFSNCTSLKDIPLTLLSNTNITNASAMFFRCFKLTSIPSLSKTKITNTNYMFGYCTNIISIQSDLLNDKITDASSMFNGCINLKNITPDFIKHITNIKSTDAMFANCQNLDSSQPLFKDIPEHKRNMLF